MLTPQPSSDIQLWYGDVFILAFNLPARVCDHGIAGGDLGSAEMERRDPTILDERRSQYARGLQRDRHRLVQIPSGNASSLNRIRTSVTNLEADVKQQAN